MCKTAGIVPIPTDSLVIVPLEHFFATLARRGRSNTEPAPHGLVSENPDFRNPDVAAVCWERVCPVSAAALYQHDLRYGFLLPVIRYAGVGSYGGRDADLHPVKQSDGRAGRGNRSLNSYV